MRILVQEDGSRSVIVSAGSRQRPVVEMAQGVERSDSRATKRALITSVADKLSTAGQKQPGLPLH